MSRLARALRWARRPVVAVWLALTIALIPAAGRLTSRVDDTAQANLPADAPSTRVAELQDAATAGRPRTDQAIVVLARDTGLTTADRQAAATARQAVADLTTHVAHLGRPGPIQPSEDGRAALFAVTVTAPAAAQQNADTTAVDAIRHALTSVATGGLQVKVTGGAALTADGGIGNQNTLLLTSLTIVVIIMLLVYRGPLLWIFPLLGTAASLILAKAATAALAAAGLTVTSISTAILTVLVLGASTDYALLLVHRYREELHRRPAPAEAMAIALRRTLPAVTASAATVAGAMLCLLAAQSASLRGLGPVAAIAITAVLAAQLTLLPALLLIVGRTGFWPLTPKPGRPHREGSRVWRAIGTRVARRPLPVAIAGLGLLGVACLGLTTLHTSNDPIAVLKSHQDSVAGDRLLTTHFTAGATDPLTVLSPPADATRTAAIATATLHVASVAPATPIGGYSAYTVTLSVPPYGNRGYATIADLRHRLDTTAPGTLVVGGPAVQYDTTQAAHRDAKVLIPLVLAVVLLIIMLLVRAVIAPILLVLTTALSFAAALGLAGPVWHALGYPGIEAQLPLYIFVFLVALGVDYNIFLIARVREEARHLGTHAATRRGLQVTGGVITAAGAVLAATFAALSRLPYAPVAQVGSAIAIGVLLDTLLVRTVLVPAGLLLLDDRSWWPATSGHHPADPPTQLPANLSHTPAGASTPRPAR